MGPCLSLSWMKYMCEFETLMAVTMEVTVFWDVMPFSLTDPYNFFEDVNCLHFRGKEY
jgi:hypothetical protein